MHEGGTYICMEGPQFSTRAESELYRQWGADVIGMTNWQEAKLAREAEICFASLALSTDYDCWNTAAGDVVIEEILRILAENVELARRTLAGVAERLPVERDLRLREGARERDHHRSGRHMPAPSVGRSWRSLIGKYVEAKA